MVMDNVAVIIPAYKPDGKLINTLNSLVESGLKTLIVVDDGSGTEYESIFDKVTAIRECVLLRHKVNKGKGAALKTAFAYFLENCSDMAGAVTADADGQHLTEDIIAVSDEMTKKRKVILGCRDFSAEGVPPRSKMGNRITSTVFRIFFGMNLSDTQTGLRAFPTEYIARIADADGDRYEFETNMLFLMNKEEIPYGEVKISTVYIEENKSSHFRVVRDSIRIYSLILKYLFSAVASLVIDLGVFHILYVLGIFNFIPLPYNVVPEIVARISSSIVNYAINAKVVFKDSIGVKNVVKYYLLAVVQFAVATVALSLLIFALSIPDNHYAATLLKLIIQLIIYPISFRIQHKWVFNSKK